MFFIHDIYKRKLNFLNKICALHESVTNNQNDSNMVTMIRLML